MFSQALCKIPGSSSVKLPKAMIFFSFVSSAFHVCPMLRSAHWGGKIQCDRNTGAPHVDHGHQRGFETRTVNPVFDQHSSRKQRVARIVPGEREIRFGHTELPAHFGIHFAARLQRIFFQSYRVFQFMVQSPAEYAAVVPSPVVQRLQFEAPVREDELAKFVEVQMPAPRIAPPGFERQVDMVDQIVGRNHFDILPDRQFTVVFVPLPAYPFHGFLFFGNRG